jgi:hypothetical protein
LPERTKPILFKQLPVKIDSTHGHARPTAHNTGARMQPPMREKRARLSAPAQGVTACYTAAVCHWNPAMLPPKALLDALSSHASRLFNGETPLPRSEFEAQFKALLQSGFSKLDLVSREEFDSQMAVLARTRARLEALEAKVAELEARPPQVSPPPTE